MDYDEHAEAREQCFGSRFCWPGVACAFANWPCIGKLFFFPNLSLLVAQSSIYIYSFFIIFHLIFFILFIFFTVFVLSSLLLRARAMFYLISQVCLLSRVQFAA